MQRAGRKFQQVFERLLYFIRQCGFELRAARSGQHACSDVAYPLIALGQHAGDKINRDRNVVVEMPQQMRHMRAVFASRFEQAERAPRSFFIQRARVCDCFRTRAKARQHRHLPRQCVTQRVDGVDAQPVGIGGEFPTERTIACARGTSKPPGDLLVRGLRLHLLRTRG